jgi:hypothetical protein
MLTPSGDNWHEVYRTPRVDKSIRSIAYQDIPGSDTGRLWISEGQDLLWVAYSSYPAHDSNMRFTHEGILETSWFNTNLYSMQKVWDSLRLVVDNGGANKPIRVDYKLDSDLSWTAIVGDFDTSPEEEISISSATPPSAKGKRAKFRIKINTNSSTSIPVLLASIIDCYGVIPIKYNYSFNALMSDGFGLVKNKQEQDDITLGQYNTTALAGAALDAWATAATPLTMNTTNSWYNGKTVVMNGVSSRPSEKKDYYNQAEKYLINVVLNEL